MGTQFDAQAAPISAPTSIVSRTWHRWLVVFVLLVIVTTAFFDRINIGVLFTDSSFLTQFGLHGKPAMMGMLMSAFVFAYGISSIFLSFGADLIGPRKALALMTIVLAIAMGGMGLAAMYSALLFGRVIIGVAEGPQWGSNGSLVKRWFSPKEQGFANSIWTIGAPLGSAIGFPLIFYLVAHYGWRISFYTLALLNVLIVLPCIWIFLRDRPPSGEASTAAAMVNKAKEPEIPLRTGLAMFLSDWRFWMIVINDLGCMIYLWGVNSWLPSYLRIYRHFDLARAGFYSSLPFILTVVGELAGAKLSDKLQRRAIFCFGGLIGAGIFILLATISSGGTAAAWCLAWSAFFWGTTIPTQNALALRILPARAISSGIGAMSGIANILAAMAPFVMGIIIGSAGNYNRALGALVLSCLVCSVPMIPLLRKY